MEAKTNIDHKTIYNRFRNQILNKWLDCPSGFPANKRTFSWIEKYIWESRCERFINYLQKQIQRKDLEKPDVLSRCKSFFTDELLYKSEELDLILSEDMIAASKDFIVKSLEFDSELDQEEIFQALRNMWIVFGLQALMGYSVQCTPATMAYSLLYPYTDNLIDSLRISNQQKMEFSWRFEKRLQGKTVLPQSKTEQKIYDLLVKIEQEFDRQKYPKVFESLLDIHRAQTQSILLTKENRLSDIDCFKIAIDKGATSVIADAYLIAGKLNRDQLHFLFEYGAYLQILDDLQDARDDLYEGVFTCFSRKLHTQYLDEMLCKTYYLGKQVLQTFQRIYPEQHAFYGLMKQSFSLLFASTVLASQKDFSKEFLQLCERHLPFRFAFAGKHRNALSGYDQILKERFEEMKEEILQNA